MTATLTEEQAVAVASLVSANRITHAPVDIGEALLSALGYRTSSGAGQHAAVGPFLEAVCKGTDAVEAAKRFDRLRNTRNQLRYAAAPIGRA